MKKISTLGLGVVFSLASITVMAQGHDDGRSDRHQAFNNVAPNHGGYYDTRKDDHRNNNDRAYANNDRDRRGNDVVKNNVYDNRNNNRGYGNDRGYGSDRGYYKNDHAYYNNDRGLHISIGGSAAYYNNAYDRTLSSPDFFAALRVMDRENDNGRLLYAKSIVNNNYLSAEQVKELARYFSFDECRLDFVEYAYNKTIDKGNFSVVCNAFLSGNGRDQLMDFINSCR